MCSLLFKGAFVQAIYACLDGDWCFEKAFGSKIDMVTNSLHNLSSTQTHMYWVHWSDRIEKANERLITLPLDMMSVVKTASTTHPVQTFKQLDNIQALP